jgi:hypothetical protein
MKSKAAIVVVDNQKPVGIITYADTTVFFREISEGLVLVEDMEMSLRYYIEEAFPTDLDRDSAIQNALKHLAKDNDFEAKSFDRLTFGDYVNIITNSKNWSRLEQHLESKDLFRTYMEQVRDIRNQLMHFRGNLDEVQNDSLRRAHDWLERRRKRQSGRTSLVIVQPQKISNVSSNVSISMPSYSQGKYGPLQDWLEGEGEKSKIGETITLSFDDIEEGIIFDGLPASARRHRSWWANDSTSSRQALAWMRAGWAVYDVDFNSETVTFERTNVVLYQIFWADLVERIKYEKPDLARVSRTYAQDYYNLGAGNPESTFTWSFAEDGILQTGIVFYYRPLSKSRKLFKALKDQQNEIEQEFGGPLNWEEQANSHSGKIFAACQGQITDKPEKLEATKLWAIDTMLRIVNTLQPRIRELQ